MGPSRPTHLHTSDPPFPPGSCQVFCELLEFRLPSDLDLRALKLRKRAFWASLLAVLYAVGWRHGVRRKPLTLLRAVTNVAAASLWLGMMGGVLMWKRQ